MQILVISATREEIAPFLEKNILADHLITGVGAPSCCYYLLKRLQQKKYDLVIQAGIAGTFNADILLGTTVLVKKDLFADIGALEKSKFKSIFEMGLADKNEWPYKNGWLENEHVILSNSALKKVSGITVNTISDNRLVMGEYLELYKADIESMEGAAFHYVCLQENVNFLQIRTISNRVGERDKAKWKLKEAIENLNNELIKIVKQWDLGK